MADRVASVDQSRKTFAANVSHELRTPIAIIEGNLERLLERRDGAANPDDTETLRVLHQEALTLSHLIDDLFTLTRLEESALPLELRKIRLQPIAAQAVAGLKSLAWEQRKVTIESIIPPGMPSVHADPTRVQQILHNLLYNALRHTPEGGLIVVGATAHQDLIEIAVTDTGIGIAPEDLATIFDRYHPSHRRGATHGESAGLGLHLVQQLVEAQGGRITIDSTLGQGTTVTFTLPRA
jgi:signal transduction histidine kinase